MADPIVALDMAAVRAALRAVHTTLPESAAVLDRAIECLEARIAILQSADPFRALVISMAETMATSNALSRDLRATIVADLARAEADREARLLVEARLLESRGVTTRQVLTQPVALGIISVVSVVVTAFATWLLGRAPA